MGNEYMHSKSLVIALAVLASIHPSAHSQAEGHIPAASEAPVVEGPRDTHACGVEPTVLDDRYYRSGRAEKTLRLPGVLPPEAPIPDTAPKKANAIQQQKSQTVLKSVEAPRDTNMFQLKPTILDEEYMRSGRAERSLRLPGVLPPGAPIPDNVESPTEYKKQ